MYLKRRRRIFKKLLIAAGIFVLGSGLSFLFTFVVTSLVPSSWNLPPWFPVLAMSMIAVAAYRPLDLFCSKMLNHYFFKKKNYGQLVLLNLLDEIALTLDLREMSNLIVNTFGEILHLQSVALVMANHHEEGFSITASYGWNVSDAKRVQIHAQSPLVKLIRENGAHILVRDVAVKAFAWQDANRLANDFDSLRAAWIMPLLIKEELIGFLAFKGTDAGTHFDETDFHFFREFAGGIARSLWNAWRVAELKMENEVMQDSQSRVLQTNKVAAIEQLATGIAHEIHNPLTIISGKAQVLLLQKDRNKLDRHVEDVLKTIVRQTKRAADITRRLLMFSQSSGSPREWVPMEQVLEDTLALVSYQTSLEGIEVIKTVNGVLPAFYANVHELREIFLNLILNAVQSIEAPPGRIRCELSHHEADHALEIKIADNGRGMAPECLEKIFHPFFTTRPNAVGLGLFVTRQIVHRYGGSIRVESRPGEGSVVSVLFPHHESSVSVTPEVDETNRFLPKSHSSKN